MNELIMAFVLCIFVLTILMTSRYFYLLDIKLQARKIMKRLDINIAELNYSFEQISYFYTLPSNITALKSARKENILIEYDYDSILFQQLKGIKIYVEQQDKHDLLLAYLTINDFRLPSLDVLMEEEKIDENSYLKISIYKLIHPVTIKQIKDEVYKQILIGRYDVMDDAMNEKIV
ncbi:hypothetical protein GCM10011351_06700 [Paraliobacillus quinghaiensis]|uniref:Uncharacterized protein n=1 Tax=Paraliobacillus quinghaiensis TaxID=470815 RepID=A0A917WRY0_9BACI|nr:hypothetical protein [Paraliobacillus quinghaiensis]GGM23580.1 hypothetical protein GCM10011351_06700 [Paraliobacillus quinghaiensis]